MAVTGWSGSQGDFVYYNQLLANANCDGYTDVDLDDFACLCDCRSGLGVPLDPDVCGRFDSDLDGGLDPLSGVTGQCSVGFRGVRRRSITEKLVQFLARNAEEVGGLRLVVISGLQRSLNECAFGVA